MSEATPPDADAGPDTGPSLDTEPDEEAETERVPAQWSWSEVEENRKTFWFTITGGVLAVVGVALIQFNPFGLGLLGGVLFGAAVPTVAVAVSRAFGRDEPADAEAFDTHYEDLVEVDPPRLKGARFGALGELWRMWRFRKKRQKLLSKGYVQWYLVDDTFPSPKFIKPKRDGAGIPKYEYKGETYLFPDKAALPTSLQGFWTFVHKRGEADPIHLREPEAHSLPADVVDEWLTMQVSSDPPSWWDDLDLSMQDIVIYAIVLFIAYVGFQRAMANGVI